MYPWTPLIWSPEISAATLRLSCVCVEKAMSYLKRTHHSVWCLVHTDTQTSVCLTYCQYMDKLSIYCIYGLVYIYCVNPSPTPRVGRPRGEVVKGVYHPYPADEARGRPFRHPNWRDREYLRRGMRRKRYPLKGAETFPGRNTSTPEPVRTRRRKELTEPFLTPPKEDAPRPRTDRRGTDRRRDRPPFSRRE